MKPLDMISRLVKFDTVSNNSNLPLIEFVENYLNDLHVSSQRVPNADGRKTNLFATIGPNEEGGIVLSGHSDVVPVDGQDWASNPFVPIIEDGKLYGRGTCDMKGFIGIVLALVPEMNRLSRPIHIALSYDEELGCLGAPRMIQEISNSLPSPEAVIVGEPTQMAAVTGHKGMATLKTTIRGFETHSSQTHRGVSAVMVAARLVTYLDTLASSLAIKTVEDSGFEPHHTTIHVGIIRGGTAINITSRYCEFLWDIRAIPSDDPQLIIDEFNSYCSKEILPSMKSRHPDCSIQTEITANAPAFLAEASPAAKLVQKLTGLGGNMHVPYVAEAGQFQAAGFCTVVCGPGSIDQAHQPDEYITLAQIDAGECFIRNLIRYLSA